jgi:hypothetical protein
MGADGSFLESIATLTLFLLVRRRAVRRSSTRYVRS